MHINPSIFRGYDIRGRVDKDLNPEVVECIGKGYGAFLIKRGIKNAVVGYDCRKTSPLYAEKIIKGLSDSGIDVFDIGLTLVGILYWAQYFLNCKGGVMVSASHNPAEHNGFKLATGFSETMVYEQIQELRRITEVENFVEPAAAGKIQKVNVTEDYYKDLLGRFSLKRKFKIVVDPSNSTPGVFVPELLRRAGCEVKEYNCVLDGFFPLCTPDPTAQEIASRISKAVLAEKADLGFSYDADGDRIGLVDELGNAIWNDIFVALFAKDVLEQNPKAKIVFNTLCSKVVEDTILQNNGVAIMCRTGHSFIKAKAQKEKAKFAGELSGHFFFLDKFYPHDDGLYGTLRILDYLSRNEQTLSQAVANLPYYISSPEIKVGCPDELKVDLIKKISDVLKLDFPEAEVIDDERAGDGVRLDMPDAMFVVRYSQNGPYLTIKFEARDRNRYDELKGYLNQLLHNYPEVDWSFGVNVESLDGATAWQERPEMI